MIRRTTKATMIVMIVLICGGIGIIPKIKKQT